ncbi:MAG: DUF1566 domain-containing protein [Elusimicrobia bacterium]|nr:DUF1566 domain-containing protein [Elusimicrobiota bacterium]
MKKTMPGLKLFALCLLLGAATGAFAEDAEVKLDTKDGSTRFSVQNKDAAPVFSADSKGNAYMVGYSSAAKYYGDGTTLTNISTHTFKIGDSYGGGKIFWVDATGTQVLIAAAEDQNTGIKWANNSTATGATLDGVYAGKANTVIISAMQHTGSYAAQVCADYSTTTANSEYYDDWYLPSKAELNLLYAQKVLVGGFTDNWYWSSTEFATPTSAWTENFINGIQNANGKPTTNYVRCVRAGPSTSIGNLPTNAETVTDGAYLSSTQTFTGSNTFQGIIAASATITGTAIISRDPVAAADAGITLTAADFGKTITVNSASAQTVTLPTVTAADIGATVTVIKLGAGRVSIQAAPSAFIEDSTSGGTIYNDVPALVYAAITLRLVTTTQWQPIDAQGAWVTN